MTLENATFIDCTFSNCRFNDRVLHRQRTSSIVPLLVS
ncbi:hypothetical protein [Bacillus altitudinis]